MNTQDSNQASETPIEQPKPAKGVKYAIDEAGVITRTAAGETTPLAVYADGVVTILDAAFARFDTIISKFLASQEKPVTKVVMPEERPAPPVVDTSEPKQDPMYGERTVEWLLWLKNTHPARYAETVSRLKITQ